MTYSDTEISAYSGSPIELYEFVGTYTTYRYTSHHRDITYNSNVYTAVALERDSIKAIDQSDNQRVQIKLPANEDIITDYAFNTPAQGLDLTVYRQHEEGGDTITYFKGTVSSVAIQQNATTLGVITVSSLLTKALLGQFPKPFFQGMCNHTLYDTRCQVNSASFSHSTTITSIASNTIVVASVGSLTGSALVGGKLVSGTEERLIIAQSGTTLTIQFPFTTSIVATASCTVFAGCDHTVTTCRDTFNNVINYGGQPFIPDFNPFRGNVI